MDTKINLIHIEREDYAINIYGLYEHAAKFYKTVIFAKSACFVFRSL